MASSSSPFAIRFLLIYIISCKLSSVTVLSRTINPTETNLNFSPPTKPVPPIIRLPPNESQIVRQQPFKDAFLPCKTLSPSADRLLEWWYKSVGQTRIGTLDLKSGNVLMNWTRDGAYSIETSNKTGSLLIRSARRELVERYECVVVDNSGRRFHEAVYFRLDFSFWYEGPFSLFWGSCLCALIVCASAFILNILWIILRNSILWWIKRMERLSRVRAMLVALEKYRLKQMDALHENYSRRMSTIRDNYHSQVEQMRSSYTNQSDRFRDWGHGHMATATHHIDSIRDNYNAQMGRLREFGSRRAEQIWETYDRRMQSIRAFTIHQRVRLCNQYKVKQRYLNKLLEAIASDSANFETIRQKEAAIRAVLDDLPEHPLDQPHSSDWSPHLILSEKKLTRCASLPEFGMVFVDDTDLEDAAAQQPSTSTWSRSTALRIQFLQPLHHRNNSGASEQNICN